MTTRFERDTRVTAEGPDRWRAEIDRGWWIIAGPNGGYVAAILLRAMDAAVGDASRVVRSLTIHYTSPPKVGPVGIVTRVERTGGRMTTISARMEQEGRLLAMAVGAFSSARTGGLEFDALPMPEVPPASSVAPIDDDGANSIPLRARFDTRPCLGSPLRSGAVTAVTGGWIAFKEPPVADAAAIADAWVPAAFTVLAADAPPLGVPTVDLTVHFRAALPLPDLPADAPFLVRFESKVASEGFIEEDGVIWSADGRLLAQVRQLAVLV
jgi:acyl-CoA thioesterase